MNLAALQPAALRERLPGQGRLRTTTIRRALAVALLATAAILLLAGREAQRYDLVVVAAHDLRPGAVLTDADVRLTRLPARTDLSGLLNDPHTVVGSRLTSAVGAGEALTPSRLLSSRLPEALTGQPTARLVPVRPADPAVAGLLRAGDVVDVIDEQGRVLAADTVVAVPAAPTRTGAGPADTGGASPVLLAVREEPARRVAASGLANALTLVLH
ncbi:SAF domain-containing protein [Gordonia caeni]|uniref:SAF domain-containing protein n=1 Tax=Gordonia caeni TaxID=1007097 RepID=A0ABP7PU30_9ACTN